MKISLEFFGPIRDRVETAPDILELDSPPATLEALIEMVACQLSAEHALRGPHLRIAINDQLYPGNETISLKEGDRIAVLSPFSGG